MFFDILHTPGSAPQSCFFINIEKPLKYKEIFTIKDIDLCVVMDERNQYKGKLTKRNYVSSETLVSQIGITTPTAHRDVPL